MQFWKDKFELILVTVVLTLLIILWVNSGYRPDLKEFVIIISGAWLALLRVVQRPSTVTAGILQTEEVTADNIEKASTESGDIINKGK